ncbi:hypothetical protein ZTR_09950 [Talaromyces verruculosus]|nr:hypothetical protein ZTR_09950 [Talaromyces verruculosus]
MSSSAEESEEQTSSTPTEKKVVLAIEDKAPENSSDKKPVLSFYFRIWRYSTLLDHVLRTCGIISAVVYAAALPLMTLVFGNLIDNFNDWDAGKLSPSDFRSKGSKNALWFTYLFLGNFDLASFNTLCFRFTATRCVKALRRDFLRSILRQDLPYFDTNLPGSVAALLSNNADLVEVGLGEKLGVFMEVAANLPLTMVVVIVVVIIDTKIDTKILAIYSKAGGLAEEALSTIRIVTAFNAGGKLRARYDAYLDNAKQHGIKRGPVRGVMYGVQFAAMFCAYAFAWFYGIRLLAWGEISSRGHLITVLTSVLIGLGATQAEVTGHISLQNITFAYPSRPTVKILDNLTLEFEAGKTTAIVGSSGSGKSTILALITRFFDPLAGSIAIYGNPIDELNIRWLRSRISFVQQEPVLFSDNIFTNVCHGFFDTKMDLLPEQERRALFQKACEEAFAHKFVQDLLDKYDTQVGDGDGRLSGGQKQRIAIARSIIRNPPILLLDEATSALDPKSERIVQAAVDNVSKTRTTVIVANKLSTVQRADKIIVLSKGRLVEQGTHQELLAQKGAYFNLLYPLFLGGLIASIGSGAVFPVQAVVFSRAVLIFQLPLPQLAGYMIHDGTFWGINYLVLAAAMLMCYAGLGFFFTVAASDMMSFYRSQYFGAMLNQDVSFFESEGQSAGVMTGWLFTDPQRVEDVISTTVGFLLITIVNVLGSCVLALVVGWKLALVAIFGLTLEEKVVKMYDERLARTSPKFAKITITSAVLFGLCESLYLATLGLIFWYGVKLLSQGEYDVQTFFTVFVAVIFGGQAARFLFGYTVSTTKAHAAANNIINLLRSHPQINTSNASENLSPPDTDVSIEFKDRGERIGIVGALGCGKTTVISLLERFYKIGSGEILINGSTTLYQGSIRYNVLVGVPPDYQGVSDEKILKAYKDASIHDFIESLPEGYDTDAGARGLSLSGGQRQRIAIARALIREPQFLLFDEATSALDTENELIVQEAINVASIGPGRTTIAVVHRLSTIRGCDRILVLDAGRVVEEGNHNELMARMGQYYEMVCAQGLDREVIT